MLAAALVMAGVFGGALILDEPRVKQLLDIRIGPGTAQQPGDGQGSGQGAGQGSDPSAGDQAGGDQSGGGTKLPAEAGLDTPPPGVEEQDAPLGVPEPPAVGSDSYRFLAVNGDGSPVGYSPCRPLHYVVNAGLEPAGAKHLVTEAVATISAATGITFIYDGTTN